MPEPGSEIEVGTVLGGTYQIDGLLGRGGMGAVWSAAHLRLRGKRVAVKVLLGGNIGDEIYQRFQREADIASRIGHPNIVEVHDWNTLPSGQPYLVMELLQGESLAKRISRGPVPLETTLAITRQIGSALNAAHRAGVVHRDLKPDNIFLCPTDSGGVVSDHVKVLDFGISKIKNSSTVQTQEARILGTPQYMAPEQASGKNQQIDQRTDLFALGAIVYEMLSGRPAFQGDNLAMVVFKVVFEEPTPVTELVPGLPANVIAAVQRALAKDPAQRYPDVLSFVAELTGRPLHTLDKISAQSAAQAVAFDRTVDSQQQFAATAASGQTPLPLAKGTQPSGATPLGTQPQAGVPAVPDAAPPSKKKSKTALWVVLGLLVVGGGVGAAVVATQKGGSGAGPTTSGPTTSGPTASTSTPASSAASSAPAVVATSSAPAVVTTSSAPAVVTASSAPAVVTTSSAPAVVATSSAKPAVEPTASATSSATAVAVTSSAPAVSTPSSKPAVSAATTSKPAVAATSSQKKVEDKPEEDPAEIAAELKEARNALNAGQYDQAVRAARHTLYTKKTEEAYAVMALAYCGMKDLSNVNAAMQNVGARRKAHIRQRCKQMGFELP